jgi:hypothetical protein
MYHWATEELLEGKVAAAIWKTEINARDITAIRLRLIPSKSLLIPH